MMEEPDIGRGDSTRGQRQRIFLCINKVLEDIYTWIELVKDILHEHA